MADATLYSEEMFVLLIPGKEQTFLTPDELLEKLQGMLAGHQDNLPRDLQKISAVIDQAKHLRDTSCDFEASPGISWQWYAVRLEK